MSYRYLLPVLIIGILKSSAISGQQIEIISPDHPVTDNQSLAHIEPHVAVHPSNPEHLLVGSIVASPGSRQVWHGAAFSSQDGGNNWVREDFESMDRCIDPWVMLFEDNTGFWMGIELLRDAEDENRFRLVRFDSKDGGRTWQKPFTAIGRTFDHEIVVQGLNGDLYMIAKAVRRDKNDQPRNKIFLGKSENKGQTFDEINIIDMDKLDITPTGIALYPQGEIVISFIKYNPISTYIIRSTDGGVNFGNPEVLSENCGGGDSFMGYPFMVKDNSGEDFRGNLYHACIREDFNGISFSYSNDKGVRWSEPLELNTRPDDGKAHIRTPMLNVNQDGVIGAAWYDRINDPEGNCQDVYFTASLDGGKTFLEPVRISTETSCPSSEGNGWVSNSWPMGGDYSSLNSGPDGTFHLVWADSRTGVFQLRMASIRVHQ